MKLITSGFLIKPEPAGFAGAVEQLYTTVFGAARFQKTSHQFRIGVAPVRPLSWVAMEGDRLAGVIRYWPIEVGPSRHPALLLGPLAIVADRKGRGIGSALVHKTLALARQSLTRQSARQFLGRQSPDAAASPDLVFLVGDVAYYERFGFIPATPHGFVMPGERRPDRLQVFALKNGVLGHVAGDLLRHCETRVPAAASVARMPAILAPARLA